MNKAYHYIAFILLTPIVCGVFGIFHDQISCSISPEYYTEFKFHQFGLTDEYISGKLNFRIGVSIVGWKATWWTSIPILILLLIAFLARNFNQIQLKKLMLSSWLIIACVTLAFALAGIIIGYITFDPSLVNPAAPHRMLPSYHAVGSMHNLSYLGGITGLLIAFIRLLIRKKENVAG